VQIPRLDSVDLAYETGLHIGDGCLSHYLPRTYRYAISGDFSKEKDYYELLIIPLVKSLYGLQATISHYSNSIYATVYSKELALFKLEQVGLPIGVKDNLYHLPSSIVERGRKNRAALLSDLYDADGSVKVRRTCSGNYPRISLAQKTRPIIEDVQLILREDFDISSTMYRNDYFDARVGKVETRWFLDINGYPNFFRFVGEIGTRHPYVQSRIQRNVG
jgi:intein/homing endonuclease